jgi:acyl-CoA synthetase (AMP-forming)/AMP-acid ligase II
MQTPLVTTDFLRRAETVYGARTGVIDEPDQPYSLGSLTYREVAALARAQAAALDQMGIEPGQRVAIVSKNSARLLVALLGVSSFGRVLVPINFRLNPAEIAYIVEHSQASLLLVDPELGESLARVACARKLVLGRDDAEIYDRRTEPIPREISEDSTATLNYTSGTTAQPKGVQLTHRNLWLNATLFGLHAGVNDRDVYLHNVPLFHCNGWGLPFILAGLGATQIIQRQVEGAEILRRVERYGVTFMSGAPTVVSMILDAAQAWSEPIPGRDRVRIVVAGAPPPTRTIERIESELGWEFLQIYGLTETSPLLTINRHRMEYDGLTPSNRASLLARAGAPVLGTQLSTGETGEILARANQVLAGYWRDEAASAAALAGGWFHTGDGGTIDEQGYVTISDRKKDVIISGGENVSSIEVEDALCAHPAVAEVAVIGVPHEKWGETVKALVVLKSEVPTSERELIDHCRQRLAHYKCPTSIEFRPQLARTATGKLQKFKLREPYWAGRERQVN